MTKAKYKQLKKRAEWLYVILQHCQGEGVPALMLDKAVQAAKHFHADILGKLLRYESKESKNVVEVSNDYD